MLFDLTNEEIIALPVDELALRLLDDFGATQQNTFAMSAPGWWALRRTGTQQWQQGLKATLKQLRLPMNRVVILGNIPLLPQSGPPVPCPKQLKCSVLLRVAETTLTKYNKVEQTVAKESGARDAKSRPGSARRSAPWSSEDTTCTSTRITSPLTIRFFSKECCSRPFEPREFMIGPRRGTVTVICEDLRRRPHDW